MLHLCVGLTIAFVSTLLIYFKQKPVLHHLVIVIAVSSLYFIFFSIHSKLSNTPKYLAFISHLVLVIVCWSAPQFIYQIRPFTFYIAGFAIGSIILTATSVQLIDGKSFPFPWNMVVLFTGYLIGQWIPATILQFIIVGLLAFYLILYFLNSKPGFRTALALLAVFVICGQLYFQLSKSIQYFHKQTAYEDKVVFTSETQFHDLVITQWQKDYWFFIDKLKNICSIDEYLFYEPMAHGAFQISASERDILVIGGENGCLLREVLKYDEVRKIDVVSYDSLLRRLGKENKFFTRMNENSFDNPKVRVLSEQLLDFVSTTDNKYDVIFIDLPDPRSIEANQYYTKEFYSFLKNILKDKGVFTTQAGSPYFATEAFYSIGKTIRECGFETLPIHNQILTLGEWGWYICSLSLNEQEMHTKLTKFESLPFQTKWWNQEAASLVSSFGKIYSDTMNIGINTLDNPLVYQYYLKGNWNME